MQYRLYILLPLGLFWLTPLHAQQTPQRGEVSFVTSQNVYVKFENTGGISLGDTLFVQKDSGFIPALVVSNKSSSSCVCRKLTTDAIKVSDAFFARTFRPEKKVSDKIEKEKPVKVGPEKSKPSPAANATKPVSGSQGVKRNSQGKLKTRLSAASYTNLTDSREQTRMRYAITMQGNQIRGSRFSTDVNVAFRHTLGQWDSTKAHINDALKIYALAGKYDFNKTTNLVVGRKINPKIASLGAVDGLQFEKGLGHFLLGAIAGARPDLRDYSINFDLKQVGLYAGHEFKKDEKNFLSTLGIIEQHNKSAVDRRFVYLQHSSDLSKNMSLFSSCEVDLYAKVNGEVKNQASLTNLFLSVQYRPFKKLSINTAYDSRKNIIYYESYKSYIDQLIDNETRQGLRLGFNYRPWKRVSLGANANWRFQKSDINGSKNLNTYLNFNSVPLLKTSFSLTTNLLQTSFIHSQIYGIRCTKDILKGKGSVEIYYRRVEYDYVLYGYQSHQNVAGGNLSLQIFKGLSLYFYGEKAFDSQRNDYTLINTKLMQRF